MAAQLVLDYNCKLASGINMFLACSTAQRNTAQHPWEGDSVESMHITYGAGGALLPGLFLEERLKYKHQLA